MSDSAFTSQAEPTSQNTRLPSALTLDDLDFHFPEELIATHPVRPSRVMWVDATGEPSEISISELVQRIPPNDVLVLNDTRVLPRRVFSLEGFEVLFIREVADAEWEVLFPASRLKGENHLQLPEGVTAELVHRGLPQRVRVSHNLDDRYFERCGELPLPPYIQKARGERHESNRDRDQYQTAWATKPGSLAAPTASLHFSQEDLQVLRERGVRVVTLTLHVGLGTFLPIKTHEIDQHEMHEEFIEIPTVAWEEVRRAKERGSKVWALGTTAVRSLESVPAGAVSPARESGVAYSGFSQLYITPGFDYKIVDCLLTNFHQPRTTLIALVGAFAGLQRVKACYQWAIARKFRLFSYGDLSVWLR